ncbi:hypothetical protein [Dipodfec virus UOA04_Rod_623]|nr:hypothetical protein [Dipodfec virus UOA04_Rod_623]
MISCTSYRSSEIEYHRTGVYNDSLLIHKFPYNGEKSLLGL